MLPVDLANLAVSVHGGSFHGQFAMIDEVMDARAGLQPAGAP